MLLRNVVVARAGLFVVLLILLFGVVKCGGPKGEEKILLLPNGYFALRQGEKLLSIDNGVEERYAAVFNASPAVVQCPLYRAVSTRDGKEFFLGMVLDTVRLRALFLPIKREQGRIDTLLTDSSSYVWYRYSRNGVRATACIYLHEGRVPYIIGSTDLSGSSTFTLDSLRNRFIVNR